MTSLVACAVTALLLRFFLPKLPIRYPSDDRWNAEKIPTAGGITFLPVFAFYSLISPLFVASLIIWFMGLVDDVKPLSPRVKLLTETAAALFLVFFGWQLHWFGYPVLTLVLSVFWIVGLTNAFNLIDNMDGLSTGVSIIALVFIGLLTGNPLQTMVLLGICCGFLVFNFPPAKVFMGDCGALFIGLNVACMSMDARVGLLALLILVVPLADTTFVTVRRLLKKKSPAKGGLDHLSHELVKITHSQLAAMGTLWTVGLLGGLLALWI